jgi:hypothetical protein
VPFSLQGGALIIEMQSITPPRLPSGTRTPFEEIGPSDFSDSPDCCCPKGENRALVLYTIQRSRGEEMPERIDKFQEPNRGPGPIILANS